MSSKFPSLPCFPKDDSSSIIIFFPLRLPPFKIYISHTAVISDLCLCNLLWPASSAASYGLQRFAGGLCLPSETSSHRAHSHTCLLGARAPQERTLCACVCVNIVMLFLHLSPFWLNRCCTQSSNEKWYLLRTVLLVSGLWGWKLGFFCWRNSTQFKVKSLKRMSLSCTGDILLLAKIISQTSKWNLVTKRLFFFTWMLVLLLFRQFYHGFANVLHLLFDFFFFLQMYVSENYE